MSTSNPRGCANGQSLPLGEGLHGGGVTSPPSTPPASRRDLANGEGSPMSQSGSLSGSLSLSGSGSARGAGGPFPRAAVGASEHQSMGEVPTEPPTEPPLNPPLPPPP